MRRVLTAGTKHLLCYYVLSGRYSQRDIATYANWAPNSGTEEWLEGCSRPAGKQEPRTPADCREGFTGQFQDCENLVLKLGLMLNWLISISNLQEIMKGQHGSMKDKWLTLKHIFRQKCGLPHHMLAQFSQRVQNWLHLSNECSGSDWECCSSGKMTDITVSLSEYYQALVTLCRISCATCFKVAATHVSLLNVFKALIHKQWQRLAC